MTRTASNRVENLPADLSRMIGRRAETAAIKRSLSESRLVTLTGVGGVGKTRLAVHAARQVRAAFPDGVCLVALADLATPELLAATVMSAVSIGRPASTGVDELGDLLSDRQLLLVLDNCEHLAEACAELVTVLLRRCPRLRVLATSRERLRIEGEVVYGVPPLPVPADGEPVEPADLSRYDALALFLDRASAAHPGQSLRDPDAETVAALCRRLDGLPLAIELMAGRAASLPLTTLAEQTSDRLRALSVPGSRSAPPRHRTLRAALEYSHALCSDPARRLWARMSVFAGGAPLDAVLAVCADDAQSVLELESALAELVDKSIVAFDGVRYRLLETIRAFGREKLRDHGEEGTLRVRHRDHFAALAIAPETGAWRPATNVRLQQLLAEMANLRAALEFCVSEPSHRAAGLRMAASLWQFWGGCGLQREGRHWLGELLAGDEEPSRERMMGLWVDGCLAALDDAQDHALRRAEECVEVATKLGDQSGVAHATYVRGLALLFDERSADAVGVLQTAVRMEREVPDPNPVLTASLMCLGIAGCLTQRLDLADEALAEAHDRSKAHRDELAQSWTRGWLAVAALLDGRQQEAVAGLEQVLTDARSIGDIVGMSAAIEFLGWAAMDVGDDERAAELIGVSEALAAPITHLVGSRELRRWHQDRLLELARRMGRDAFDGALQRGRGRSVDEGVAFALEERTTRAQSPDEDHFSLTQREREVALLVAEGMSNKEIAAQLVISPRTAETHVEHILGKLGFTSRSQVIALFARKSAPHSDSP